jgi:hypothetical protein
VPGGIAKRAASVMNMREHRETRQLLSLLIEQLARLDTSSYVNVSTEM